MRRLPIPLTDELRELTPDVPAGVFDGDFARACERLDRFVGALACELADAMSLADGPLPAPRELARARGWSDEVELPLRWLLGTLELYGFAARTGSGWRLERPAGTPRAAALRDEAVAAYPRCAPAYRVLELSAAALPAVARGEARGEDALFGPTTLGLWFDYFSNDNPLYAPNNALAALAAERAVPADAAILEVGGGGGSAAQALLEALLRSGKPPSRYVFTELHPAFLRRGTRVVHAALPPGCELATLRYDLDLDPAEQGVKPGAFDLVLAVNTLHLAQDVVTALRRLRSLLAPGGALVLGELIRPGYDAAVHLELPFTLLKAYREAPPSAGIRERPGFLCADGWRVALLAAGFDDVGLLPAALALCVERYPGFYCGALTARAR